MRRLLALAFVAALSIAVRGPAAADSTVPQRHTLALTAGELDEYVGTYAGGGSGITYIIMRKGTELDARIVGQDAFPIYASRPDHFFYTGVPSAYIEFVRDKGRVVGLVLTQHATTLAVPKLSSEGKPLVDQVLPDYPAVVSLDAATLNSYTGSYTYHNYTLTIGVKNAHVFAQITGQQAFELYPSAKDNFYYKAVDGLVQFHRDARRNVIGLTLTQNGFDVDYDRTHVR